MRITLSIFFVFTILIISQLKAEGTKELSPLGPDSTMLFLSYTSDRVPFALFDAAGYAEEYRLNITICDSNEIIYFGFNPRDSIPTAYDLLGNPISQIPQSIAQVQIKNQGGSIVFSSTTVPNVPGQGYISDFNEAINGPSDVTGATGYNAFSYQAPAPGDYYMEFQFNALAPNPNIYFFKYFDITVASPLDSSALPGRVWSKTWQVAANDFFSPPPIPKQNAYNATMYIYSDDGLVTSVDFNGFAPAYFFITSNQTGTANTGNLVADRQSVVGKQSYGQYRIFLNAPDSSCFPTGLLGGYNQSAGITGCFADNVVAGSDTGCININANQAGPGELMLELNGSPGYQTGTEDRLFVMNLDSGNNCIEWDLKDGLGNKVNPGDTIQVNISFLSGLTHLPMNDVEYHPDGFKVKVIRPAGPNPKLFWDDSQLPGGTTNLSGCTTPTGCHSWSLAQGNLNTVNTWWFASEARDTTFIVVPSITASSDSFSLDPTQGAIGISTPSTGIVYEWSPAVGLSCTDCKNPIAQPDVSTVYTVKITDADGCIFFDTVEVELLIPVAIVPNAFSPNGDNLNDILKIERKDIVGINFFRIYDRWGKLVFETDMLGIGWDGTRKGKPMDAGTYVYEYDLKSVFGDAFKGKGQVALIR